MKSYYCLSILLIIIYSCRNQQVQSFAAGDLSVDTVGLLVDKTMGDELESVDTMDAREWLIEVIETHLNTGGYPMEDICTPRYYEYKTDATQVGYDGGMEENAFHQKWKDQYQTKSAGIGTAFLISGQDNGKVKVTKCTIKSNENSENILFTVVIDDIDFKQTYHRDIKILPIGKAYLIDDIVEYD